METIELTQDMFKTQKEWIERLKKIKNGDMFLVHNGWKIWDEHNVFMQNARDNHCILAIKPLKGEQ